MGPQCPTTWGPCSPKQGTAKVIIMQTFHRPRWNRVQELHLSWRRRNGQVSSDPPPHSPPPPLVNSSPTSAHSNKGDELFFLVQSNGDFKDCSVFCFTETWLDPAIRDPAVQPPGYTLFRADRSSDLSNKSRRGECVCVCVGGGGGGGGGKGRLAFSSTKDGASTMRFSPPLVLQNLKLWLSDADPSARHASFPLLLLLVSTYLPRPTLEQQSTTSLPASSRLKTLTQIAQ